MLRTDSIYVWRVALDVDQPSTTELASWRSLLSESELRKADAFHRAEHRMDYLTAHVALRTVLGKCLGIAPERVQFAVGDSGAKPRLDGESAIQFNLSHTQGAALIGVTPDRELGIDIEWHRPMEDLDAMARTVMSDEELRHWKALEVETRTVAFYNLWTRKEAYLKAIGLGLYRSLQDVTVPVSALPLAHLSAGGSIVQDRAGEGVWRVTDIPADHAYSASVAWAGTGVTELIVRELVRNGAEWSASE